MAPETVLLTVSMVGYMGITRLLRAFMAHANISTALSAAMFSVNFNSENTPSMSRRIFTSACTGSTMRFVSSCDHRSGSVPAPAAPPVPVSNSVGRPMDTDFDTHNCSVSLMWVYFGIWSINVNVYALVSPSSGGTIHSADNTAELMTKLDITGIFAAMETLEQ